MEVLGDRKHCWPTRARKKTECPLPSTPRKHEGKAATKPSPKLQNLGHPSRCEQIYHAPGVEGQSVGEALQDAASPDGYGQSCDQAHEDPIMQGTHLGDGRRHAAEPCVHGQEEIWHPAGGKLKMTEFGFPRHPQKEGSSLDAKIRSLSWFGWPSQRPGDSLCFLCPLESNWTPSATSPAFWRIAYCPGPRSTSKEFPGPCNRTLRPLTIPRSPSPRFRGNSPHLYARKSGLQEALILNLWTSLPSQSWRPRPAPLPTQLWRLLRQNWLEVLKAKLVKEWTAIPKETFRVACASFSARLRTSVKNKAHYIE